MRRRSIMVFASPRQSILGPRPAPGLAPPASACPGGPRPVGGPGCSDLQGTVPPGEAKAPSPLDWQGPSPLPQRPAGIRTSRGPKPPASARPAHDGRFAPAGSGAGLCPSRTCRSTGHRPARAGGNAGRVSCSRPERRRHFHRFNGRGHCPCHSATLILGQPGAKAPGQRPTRPWRALRPRRVGRWPLSFPDLPVYRTPSRTGGGNADRVSWSRPHRRKRCHRVNGRGHRPCHSATLILVQPGAKAPGQRPTRPWRALLARRVGRWPLSFPDLSACRARSRPKGHPLSPERTERPGRPSNRHVFSTLPDATAFQGWPRNAAAPQAARQISLPIATAVSAMRFEKPHSLSYHDRMRTIVPSMTLVWSM